MADAFFFYQKSATKVSVAWAVEQPNFSDKSGF